MAAAQRGFTAAPSCSPPVSLVPNIALLVAGASSGDADMGTCWWRVCHAWQNRSVGTSGAVAAALDLSGLQHTGLGEGMCFGPAWP